MLYVYFTKYVICIYIFCMHGLLDDQGICDPFVWEICASHSYREADGEICDLFELFSETATLKCYGESWKGK